LHDLLSNTEPVLTFMIETMREFTEQQYVFLLLDQNGIVQYSISNKQPLPDLCKPGMDWSEEAIGSTAFSLALKSGDVTSVSGLEHSHPALKQFFSIVSPVRGNQEKIIGYLMLIGDQLTESVLIKIFMQVCLRSIMHWSQKEDALKDLRLKNKLESAIIKSISDGFLVLKPDGVITHANNKAAELLGQDGGDKIIGRKLTEFILSDLIIFDVFKTGKPIIDREVFIKLPNRTLHILKNAFPVHDEEGKVIAVIDHFKEIKYVHKLVNQMVGAKASFTFDDIIYTSNAMKHAVKTAQAASKASLSVLIQGESGTGKELFAHAIHNNSDRRNGPFVIIDCAAMPRELVEAELFGYVDGAFTGARRGGRPGKFELANGGTVFLDEIGEMPLDIQAKFLRALQSRCIVRVGGSEVIPVDIRVIAATNRDLQYEVQRKNFREDLFYRLNVLTVNVPPLRSRPEDIVPLVHHFIRSYSTSLNKPDITISPEAMKILLDYHWPGNVRELENVIGRAVSNSEKAITPEDLCISTGFRNRQGMEKNSFLTYSEMEKRNILAALASCQGNKAKAAQMLGIARSTFYKKLKLFEIE